MGKKNKKLKKKKSSFSPQPPQVEKNNFVEKSTEVTSAPATASAPQQVKETVAPAPEFQYVKKDVRKILILLGIIIVVLIGLYIMDIKTHYLASTGEWIYKILNIQAQ